MKVAVKEACPFCILGLPLSATAKEIKQRHQALAVEYTASSTELSRFSTARRLALEQVKKLKRVRYSTACYYCFGSGRVSSIDMCGDSGFEECPRCYGSGRLSVSKL
jgi:DnaJ-class molecular chaperone